MIFRMQFIGAAIWGDFDQAPNAGVWILEIQIKHPELPYGAFFEDLLI